jgi:hypothetical protein
MIAEYICIVFCILYLKCCYRDAGVSPQIELKLHKSPGDPNDISSQETFPEKFKSHFVDTIKKPGLWQALDWDPTRLGDLVNIAADFGSTTTSSPISTLETGTAPTTGFKLPPGERTLWQRHATRLLYENDLIFSVLIYMCDRQSFQIDNCLNLRIQL